MKQKSEVFDVVSKKLVLLVVLAIALVLAVVFFHPFGLLLPQTDLGGNPAFSEENIFEFEYSELKGIWFENGIDIESGQPVDLNSFDATDVSPYETVLAELDDYGETDAKIVPLKELYVEIAQFQINAINAGKEYADFAQKIEDSDSDTFICDNLSDSERILLNMQSINEQGKDLIDSMKNFKKDYLNIATRLNLADRINELESLYNEPVDYNAALQEQKDFCAQPV